MASSLLAVAALIAGTASVSASSASETVSSNAGGAVSWVTAPAASFSFPGVTLNGSNQTVTYTPNFDIQDTRGTGAGWNVTLQATTFSTGGATPVTLNATLTEGSATWACDSTSTCTVANNGTLTYPITVTPGGAAVKVLDAGANTGMGAMNTGSTAVFSLGVPASATTGTYTSTWTYTIGTAP